MISLIDISSYSSSTGGLSRTAGASTSGKQFLKMVSRGDPVPERGVDVPDDWVPLQGGVVVESAHGVFVSEDAGFVFEHGHGSFGADPTRGDSGAKLTSLDPLTPLGGV